MAIRTAEKLKELLGALLRDDAPDFDIDPSEVRALLVDIIESVPSLGLTAEQVRDLVGGMLAVLDPFEYSERTNILKLDLSAYEPIAPRFYLGLSDDARPNAAEATIRSGTGSGLVPGFSNMRVLIFRIASDPDISHVEFGDARASTGSGTSRSTRGGASTRQSACPAGWPTRPGTARIP